MDSPSAQRFVDAKLLAFPDRLGAAFTVFCKFLLLLVAKQIHDDVIEKNKQFRKHSKTCNISHL